MKNTGYDGYLGPRLSREAQLRRIRRVMDAELTEAQRQALEGYYLQKKNIPQLARERGVNKSTICRTLQRAERRLRRFLRY
ncbi:MAG: sigma factor-like helix-turn-helix DNA-binding protein [Oscillospiraceae bacterium]